ncbi:zinc ribbon domain-containing protein [Kangiella profundi]|uniref:Zinc ribbon domain-containing protein n=1 Tax=Kangiella profundi TaxID=1561924 RepID=A0A2K9A5K4_9GAMM|nr:zinc ribbon domain-containing protein [Kangiella profundi]AUD78020.1 zinc ribbon domain-containing protein [Kangiella profundi]GGE90574.1 hypothetical protein GCM10011356_00910 [Kangiella profundi]
MLVCDKCSAGIIEGSKFCPQCGDPVTDADRVNIPVVENNIANVEIAFGYSSSQNFSKAVNISKNIPSYSVKGDGKSATHSVVLPITEVDLIINLYDLVGGWKSSKMLINGHTATKKDLTYYGVGCFRSRLKAYNPQQYCFGERDYEVNIWGCKRLNMPVYEWGGGWLDYGEFDKSGVWHIDKDRIKDELESAIKENELCPILSRKRVLETLEKLPKTIDPREDNNWEYRTNYEEINGTFKEVAIGIKPNIKNINRFVIGDYEPNWVENFQDGEVESVGRIRIDLDSKDNKEGDRKKNKSDLYGSIVFTIILFIAIFMLL